MIKKCLWKGIEMPCSSIFSTFPTDRGMCCAFNMKKADQIFKKSKYVDWVQKLQKSDTNKSFEHSRLHSDFKSGKEPTPQPGLNKGLSLVLDLHSDGLSASSVTDDFQGFVGYVHSGKNFQTLRLQM